MKWQPFFDFFIMAHADIVSVNTQKTRDPNFGGFDNLKIFHTMHIYEMAAIFNILIMAHTDIPFRNCQL